MISLQGQILDLICKTLDQFHKKGLFLRNFLKILKEKMEYLPIKRDQLKILIVSALHLLIQDLKLR